MRLQQAFQLLCCWARRLRGCSPGLPYTIGHAGAGGGVGGRGLGAGSITVQDSDLFGTVFFYLIFLMRAENRPSLHVMKIMGFRKWNTLSLG